MQPIGCMTNGKVIAWGYCLRTRDNFFLWRDDLRVVPKFWDGTEPVPPTLKFPVASGISTGSCTRSWSQSPHPRDALRQAPDNTAQARPSHTGVPSAPLFAVAGT